VATFVISDKFIKPIIVFTDGSDISQK